MKKALGIILSLPMIMAAANVKAENPVRWGVRASADINIPGKWIAAGNHVDMYKTGPGFSAKAICNIPIISGFMIQPGVGFYYDTYRYDNIIVMSETITTLDPTVAKAGLRIPVMAAYKFMISDRFTIIPLTGPELNYSFYGRVKGSGMDDILKDALDEDVFAEYGQRRINIAWNIGIEMEINRHWTFTLNGSIGMNDIQKQRVSFRENRIDISFGYNF